MTPDDASRRQTEAADPGLSTWLSANAGSGKTRVLTDRVARLLLAGVQPQHILCLTYTKAAASEMQNRLFQRLGAWAMKPDDDLRAALAALGSPAAPTDQTLAEARRLFARAIEAPGGLRIQTIHSFCATLLRRFPLEAGVSPQFAEADDRAARLLRAGILEDLADRLAPAAVAEIARAFTGDDFTKMMEEVAARRGHFSPPIGPQEARALFGVPEGETAERILADCLPDGAAALLATLADAMRDSGKRDADLAARIADLPLEAPDLGTLTALEAIFLFASGPRQGLAKIGDLPAKALREGRIAPLMPSVDAFMRGIEAARLRRIALGAAQRTATLHRFASAFLPVYASAKAARGWLDFDDLITRARALLTDRRVAAWVLYRLDGGIDHILVDEAQDTSPEQWRIIELLAAEFTAGAGTRQGGRTLFVVGDKKQSIYSFQGADIAAFDAKHATFRARFQGAELQFQSRALEHSFRSAPAVLELVDTALSQHFSDALGHLVSHIAFRAAMPGRVDLWPLIPPVKAQKDENWEDPVDLIAETHHTAQLARQIAAEIKGMIDTGVQIPEGEGSRAVHAGDFLILVQRRSQLFSEVIRACKRLDLPIAGADRLKLGAELAVKDLAALLQFLATPEDDLALAALLRSPLCGWSEAELYALAQPRKGYLWEALRTHAGHPETTAMLGDLRDAADFLRPFDLIGRALIRHDGRRRLLARLGAEAEDGIDAFLAQALAYERLETPSLTGFLIWLETDDVEVKRQMDSEGQRIRVMTVHGAKGLEAPIVILPDTADRNPQDRDEIYTLPGGEAVWKTAGDDTPPLIAEQRAARRRRAENESIRLLYVALTRARSWLIIAGAGEAKAETSTGAKERIEWCWYRHVAAGMAALGAQAEIGGRLRHASGAWPPALGRPTLHEPPRAVLPLWASRPAAPPIRAAALLQPSALGGAKALPAEVVLMEADEGAARARGTALHLLLEHLPGLPVAEWPARAADLILDGGLRADVLAEAAAVLSAAHLAHLFGPGSLAEVPITADLGGRRLYGVIDRLIIGPGHVTAVDFKSNRIVPDHPHAVPDGLLRQLGAYAHALRQIYPAHEIRTAILWTRTATLMPCDPGTVRQALARATIT